MQAKVKKKMQQDPPKISVRFHTVFAFLDTDFQLPIFSVQPLRPLCLCG
jgi:hypothetical protein